MIEQAIIVARRNKECGCLQQCSPNGLWLISTDKGDQRWHSNTLGWLFTLIAAGGGELSKSDKSPAGYLYFGFGFFFVFVVDIVDFFCKPATATGTAAAAGTHRDDFLCPVIIWADVNMMVGEHRLLVDVLAMIGSGQDQRQ
jgi:hypothetical protein